MGDDLYQKMDRASRAKQFMPFDALKGFREALMEKERVYVPKKELSEERKAELDIMLRQIRLADMVEAEYFRDGEYARVMGHLSRIDEAGRALEIGGVRILFDDISDIQVGFSESQS